ncbi:MAG: FecR domain-containing protein [Pirellulales bacterium]
MDEKSNRAERLSELLAAAMEGTVTDEQCVEIEQLMADDELRSFAAEMMQFHGLLQWHGSDLAAFADQPLPPVASRATRPLPKISGRTGLFAALATSILLVSALNVGLRSHNEPVRLTSADVGLPDKSQRPGDGEQVVRYIGVIKQLSADATASRELPQIGGFVTDDAIALESGSMTVSLFDGADLKMVGPCRVTFDLSRDMVSCQSGRVQLDVYDSASRLRLQTPTGEVLHIGTSFGVAVDKESGDTTIEVFDGEVEFVAAGRPSIPSSSRVFIPGSLVHLAANGLVTVGNEAMDWEAIEEELRFQAPPIPALTAEGVSSIVAVEPGPRAPDGWHIEDGHVSIPSLDTAEEVFQRHLQSGEVTRHSAIEAIDFQDGYGEPEHQEAVRGYLNLFDLDRPVPGLPNTPEGTNCFVVKYSGRFVVDESWRYSFVVNADDGYRLVIDGRDVLVDPNVRASQASIVTLPLEKGEHAFDLLVFDQYGFHRIELGVAVGRERQLEKFNLLRVPGPNSAE